MASDLTSAPADRARVLPLHPALISLFPRGGLRRGVTVTVRGSTSLLFALLAEATATGAWAAAVGMPDLGLRAAAELGVATDRLALVRHPGAALPSVVAALLDGMDIVVVAPTRHLTESHARRLSARARNRNAVLLATGPWPAADLDLTQEVATWTGLDAGYLAAREVRVRARGRGAATRPTETTLHLPAADGGLAEAPLHFHAPTPRGKPLLARLADTTWSAGKELAGLVAGEVARPAAPGELPASAAAGPTTSSAAGFPVVDRAGSGAATATAESAGAGRGSAPPDCPDNLVVPLPGPRRVGAVGAAERAPTTGDVLASTT